MADNRKTSLAAVGQIFDWLRMGGKKTGVACGLTVIMLFMWVRVFLGHRPDAATAAAPPKQVETVPSQDSGTVELVELPKSPGRHDSIESDFFNIKNRTSFRRNTAVGNTGTDKEVLVSSSYDPQEVIQRMGRTLKLEAVLGSGSPQVFINDHLLGVGGKLTVKNGTRSFEFEVLEVYGDAVLVRCEGIQLTLKLASVLEVVN